MDTAWLKDVCSRHWIVLSEPMTVVHDELPFTVATDGHRIVELPGHYGEFRTPIPEIQDSLRKLLAPTHADAVPFSWTGLAEFIRLQVKDVLRECARCDSSGEISVRGVQKECPKCWGSVALPKKVFIGDALFNARLFEALIENLPDTRHTLWHQPYRTGGATIDGGEWRCVVMPLREVLDAAGKRMQHDHPRFDIVGAQAWAA